MHALLQYVEALHELLSDLEASRGPRPDANIIEAYRINVQHLSQKLQPLSGPAFVQRVPKQDKQPSFTSAAVGRSAPSGSHAASQTLLQRPPNPDLGALPSLKLPTPEAPTRRSIDSSGRNPSVGSAPFKVSQAARDGIGAQNGLQDALKSELADMVGNLKDNTLAMQSAIRHRGHVLDASEDALASSTANAQQVAARAKAHVSRSRGSFCMTCVLLLAVGAVFSFMIIFIKMTSMVGYRAA